MRPLALTAMHETILVGLVVVFAAAAAGIVFVVVVLLREKHASSRPGGAHSEWPTED